VEPKQIGDFVKSWPFLARRNMEKIDVKMSTDLLKLLENIQGGEKMVRGLGILVFQASLQSNPCFCIKLRLKSL